MNRRAFLFRSLAALGHLGLGVSATAQNRNGTPSVSIAAAGDTVLGFNLQDHFDEQLSLGRTRAELFDLYARGIRDVLGAADIAIVNLECPFTERGEKLAKNFNFRARPEMVEVLKRASIDAVTVANNHAMDYGVDGMTDTRTTLDNAGIGNFGTGDDLAAARRPLIVERNGLRIGFLGYYFQTQEDMLEPPQIYALPGKPGAAGCYTDLQRIKAMVSEDVAALAADVDAVIPFFHWGKESQYQVQAYQIEIAQLCIRRGARAVLGAHPHRLQGVQVFDGAPIFYSLGNFIYGGVKNPGDTLTMVAQLTVERERVTASVVPVQFTSWPDAPFQPFVLQGEARTRGLARIAELSAGFRRTLPMLRGA
jgi:poly-gamma-glutamate synthesis protein (capsule biosynthesis protein)